MNFNLDVFIKAVNQHFLTKQVTTITSEASKALIKGFNNTLSTFKSYTSTYKSTLLHIEQRYIKPKSRYKTTVLIVDNDGSTILVKRSMSDSFAGHWELPGGGIDVSLDSEKIVLEEGAREVWEECGIVINIEDMRIVYTKFIGGKVRLHNVFIVARISSFDNIILSPDHSEYIITKLENASEIANFENHKIFCDEIAKEYEGEI